MPLWLRYVIIGIVGYFMGNISVGYLLAKLYGIGDIRKHGSGNAGSTNVLRTLGWGPSLLTLLGDCLKAFLAAQIGRLIAGDIGLLIGGSAAVVGHDFPVLMSFRGGKGIASSLGLILAVNPLIAVCLLFPFVIIVLLTRYVSLGSIIVAALYPFFTWLLMRGNAHAEVYILFAVGAAVLAIFCHRKNIDRLLHHEENRMDFERIAKIKSKIQNRNNK